MARVLVGTSGWTYASWRKTFYPEALPSQRYLEFYAQQFPTTEVNYTFYHLPKPETYRKWASQVPDTFLFAIKASRLITHTNRLSDVEEPWSAFVERARALGPRLGPILLQFPPAFRCQLDRLIGFLDLATSQSGGALAPQLAFEFRHESWFADQVYRVLERHNAALCIADSPRYPRRDVLTASFTYLRFHGRMQLFASSYSEAELAEEARKINRYLKDGVEVFVYFNNDARGHAVRNARTLRSLLEA